MQQIQIMQEQSSQRSEEIMKIVKSVEELSQMFNELQVLIVQQVPAFFYCKLWIFCIEKEEYPVL